MRAEAVSNRGPSVYQPNALPLGQTGSLLAKWAGQFLCSCYVLWLWCKHRCLLRPGSRISSFFFLFAFCFVFVCLFVCLFLLLPVFLLLSGTGRGHWVTEIARNGNEFLNLKLTRMLCHAAFSQFPVTDVTLASDLKINRPVGYIWGYWRLAMWIEGELDLLTL